MARACRPENPRGRVRCSEWGNVPVPPLPLPEVIRGVAFVPAGDSVVECLWATAPLALSVTAHTRLVLRAAGW